ncbi:MAG: hypothetical protein LBT04_05910 [Prevotellaceae bacterium]|jgi:hypothetical protein|nr:hypothetical protein [Prevotellaceae bacterium]
MKRVLTLLFLAAGINAFAQKIIVFDKETGEEHPVTPKIDRNYVEWNMFDVVRGTLSFAYGRRVNNYLSAEVDLGVTYKDYPSLWFEGFSVLANIYAGYKGVNHVFLGRTKDAHFKAGVTTGAALKIFPLEIEDYEGFYLSPFYQYRLYRFSSDYGSTSFDRRFYTNEAGLLLGMQARLLWEVIWNYYLGISFAQNHYDYVNYDNSKPVLERHSVNVPHLFAGISLGFSF